MQSKIVPLAAVSREKLKLKTVVQCHGCFDPLHTGHKLHLEEAKSMGDVLIVTVTSDAYATKQKGPSRPLLPAEVRMLCLAALDCVDYVILCNAGSAIPVIEVIQPDIYVKGADYAGLDTPALLEEHAVVEKYGGKAVFSTSSTRSASVLINELLSSTIYSDAANIFLQTFRDKYSRSDIEAIVDSFSKIRVLVIGETIVDRYIYTTLQGIAPKTSVAAHLYGHHTDSLGAAGYAANILSSFCDEVGFITYTGNAVPDVGVFDEAWVRAHLEDNVTLFNLSLHDRPTILKQREVEATWVSEMDYRQTLNELVVLDDRPLQPHDQAELHRMIRTHAPAYDLVISMDFGHGLIDRQTATLISSIEPFTSVFTQTNESNEGFNLLSSKYPSADFVCLNDIELRKTTHDKTKPIPVLMQYLAKGLRCQYLICTQGGKGCTVCRPGSQFVTVPAFARNTVDRIGAGDAFMSISSLAAVANGDPEVMGFLGNVAGAIACTKVATQEPLTKTELMGFVKSLLAR